MGRMHSKGKGMSSSALPYKRSPPSWLKTTVAEVRSIAGSDPLQQRRLDVARGLRGTVDDVEYGPSPTRKGQHEGRKDPERSRRSRDDSVSTAARARGERSSCPAFFVAAAGQKLPWLCRFSPCAEPGARCRRASYRSRRPKPSRDASFSLDVLFSHLLRSPPRSSSSTSSLPLKKKKKKTQVTDQICKLAKKGYTPSQIGVALRDQHGVAQVGAVTNSKVLRILKGSGLAPEIPEDLYYLIKKAVSMRKHLDGFRKDRDGKFRLILVESRIHRLARYYKRAKKLPPTWKYESATASALVA